MLVVRYVHSIRFPSAFTRAADNNYLLPVFMNLKQTSLVTVQMI